MARAGRPLIVLTKLLYEADRPFLLVGRHGVGKSEILERAAAELDINYICRDLSLMEPPDLVGLPRLDGPVTRFIPPSFLPAGGRGLLVFEELNRCQSFMRTPALQLLTARSLNDYMLPAGWLPVAAINPPEEGYEVTDLDQALLSRFVRIDVEPDRGEWLAWARDNRVHADIITYVDMDETIFDTPESNPRSWKYASDVLHAAAKAMAPREALREAIAGVVGPARAAAFFRAIAGDESPLTADDVLSYPKHGPRLRGWVKDGRLDLVRGSLLAVQKRLQSQGHYDEVRGNIVAWKNLGRFLGDLPGDLREQAAVYFKDRGYNVPPIPKRTRS
jgi:MoxR-like ATPase